MAEAHGKGRAALGKFWSVTAGPGYRWNVTTATDPETLSIADGTPRLRQKPSTNSLKQTVLACSGLSNERSTSISDKPIL